MLTQRCFSVSAIEEVVYVTTTTSSISTIFRLEGGVLSYQLRLIRPQSQRPRDQSLRKSVHFNTDWQRGCFIKNLLVIALLAGRFSRSPVVCMEVADLYVNTQQLTW